MIEHINYTNSFGKTTLQNSFCKMTLHNPICKMDLQIELTNSFCQTILQNGFATFPLYHSEARRPDCDAGRPRPPRAQGHAQTTEGAGKLEKLDELEAGTYIQAGSWTV